MMSEKPAKTDGSPMREIPSVSAVVEHLKHSGHVGNPDETLIRIAKQTIEEVRGEIADGARPMRDQIFDRVEGTLSQLTESRLAPVINATGVILHTNLGRAPVSQETARQMALVAGGTVALEIDPATNQRGGRMAEITMLMHALTGAESTLVVNNNAAAVLLSLSALCSGREVIVSRGEAIEIGGGFRIPDVLRQSGATLVEVGTTNRTYAHDYTNALTENTAAILKVHQSNFRIEGFAAEPELADLATIAARAGIPLIDDLGSGSILQPADFGLAHERTIAESLSSGANVVTASGDKLLGGPQAGLISGEPKLVASIERHPLARAVRADKATLAGIAATLRHYLRGEAIDQIPVWRMISADEEIVRRRAAEVLRSLDLPEQTASVTETASTVGGGALPGETLPSWGIVIQGVDAERVAGNLRLGKPPVFGRVHEGRLILDLRSVPPEADGDLARAIERSVQAG